MKIRLIKDYISLHLKIKNVFAENLGLTELWTETYNVF